METQTCDQLFDELFHRWVAEAANPRMPMDPGDRLRVEHHVEKCYPCRVEYGLGAAYFRTLAARAKQEDGLLGKPVERKPLEKAVKSKSGGKPRTGDWKHDVEGMAPADHDAHLKHHEAEWQALQRALADGGDDEERRKQVAGKMRECAVHWQKHRLARHAPSAPKVGLRLKKGGVQRYAAPKKGPKELAPGILQNWGPTDSRYRSEERLATQHGMYWAKPVGVMGEHSLVYHPHDQSKAHEHLGYHPDKATARRVAKKHHESVMGSLQKAANVSDGVSEAEARTLGEKLGVDWEKIPLAAFRRGVAHEREHAEVVGGDPLKIARTALDHLRERADYYDVIERALGEKAKPGEPVKKGALSMAHRGPELLQMAHRLVGTLGLPKLARRKGEGLSYAHGGTLEDTRRAAQHLAGQLTSRTVGNVKAEHGEDASEVSFSDPERREKRHVVRIEHGEGKKGGPF